MRENTEIAQLEKMAKKKKKAAEESFSFSDAVALAQEGAAFRYESKKITFVIRRPGWVGRLLGKRLCFEIYNDQERLRCQVSASFAESRWEKLRFEFGRLPWRR